MCDALSNNVVNCFHLQILTYLKQRSQAATLVAEVVNCFHLQILTYLKQQPRF